MRKLECSRRLKWSAVVRGRYQCDGCLGGAYPDVGDGGRPNRREVELLVYGAVAVHRAYGLGRWDIHRLGQIGEQEIDVRRLWLVGVDVSENLLPRR